jgi:hypothetical protein
MRLVSVTGHHARQVRCIKRHMLCTHRLDEYQDTQFSLQPGALGLHGEMRPRQYFLQNRSRCQSDILQQRKVVWVSLTLCHKWGFHSCTTNETCAILAQLLRYGANPSGPFSCRCWFYTLCVSYGQGSQLTQSLLGVKTPQSRLLSTRSAWRNAYYQTTSYQATFHQCKGQKGGSGRRGALFAPQRVGYAYKYIHTYLIGSHASS